MLTAVLAVIKQAAQSASAQDWFHGYPPWLVVLVGAVLAAVILWIFAKIMRVVIWVLIALVLVGGLATAAKMYLDETAPAVRKAETLKS